MDKRLIWAIKSSYVTPTRKKLEELRAREDLFDEDLINIKDKKYTAAVNSFEKALEKDCHIVTYIDDIYPQAFREISLPPPVLYIRGNLSALTHGVYAGMVGCRKCDDYGLRTAMQLAREIGQTGAGIVSGGAEGVDAASHQGAIMAGVPTIAVFGNGVDINYPHFNAGLFERIEKSGGALISEFPMGSSPTKKTFPHRNRLIAALSTAVVVVRAGKNSGSLITANQAINMNKTVFAVPGNIDDGLSIGTNELIRDGAFVLLSAMDVIDELIERKPDFFVREKEEEPEIEILPYEKPTRKMKTNVILSEYEKEIVNIINDGYTTLPEIEGHISFEASRLTALLGMMEIKGVIRRGSDRKYKMIIGGEG